MHCGKEIKEKVKFCPFCGGEQKEVVIAEEPIIMEESIEEVVSSNETSQPIDEPVIEEVAYEQPVYEQPIQEEQQFTNQQQENPQQQQQQTGQQQSTPIISINQESMNQFTDKSKNYLSYLNKNIKNPVLRGTNNSGIFGVITFLLVNGFLALSISYALGKLSHYGSKLEMFLPVLLVLLAGQFISVLTVYLLSTKIFKNQSSLVDAFEHMYAPISGGVYITLAMLLLAIISQRGISVLFILLFLLMIFIINISYIANLWSIDSSNSGRNKFYWTIGLLIAAGIVHFVVNILLADMVGASIMSIISDVADGLLDNMFY